MGKPLRVLNIEDSKVDAILLERHLAAAGYEVTAARVDNKEGLEAALKNDVWDVVLCDYMLPEFDAVQAHQGLRDAGHDIPFIIISGTVGEEKAVTALLNGAHDFIPKSNLSRLVPAIERELKEAENRRERLAAEEALRLSEARHRSLFEYAPDGIIIASPESYYLDANPGMCKMLGYQHSELIGMHATDIVASSETKDLDDALAEVMTATEYSDEWCFKRKDGSKFVGAVIARITPDGNLMAMVRDVTEGREAAEKIKRSESQLNQAQSLSHIGSWNWDLKANSLFWSDEHFRIYGLQPGEVEPSYDLILASAVNGGRDLMMCTVERSLETREPFEIFFSILRPDGAVRLITSRGSVDADADGKAVRMHGTAQDVTEVKQAEDALRQTEQKYRSIFENSTEGIFQNTPDGRVLSVNPALARIMGYDSADEMIRECTNLGTQSYIDPALRAKFKRLLRKDGFVNGFEYEVRRKDGSTIWVSENTRIVRDEDGNELYYEGSLQDITERKRAQEELLRSEEKYRELVENAIDIIYTQDLDGNYTSINKAAERITGYSRSEAGALNMGQVVAPAFLERAEGMIAAKVAGEERPSIELEIITKDGRPVQLDVNTSVIYEDGVPVGLQGIARDITERKRAEAATARLVAIVESSDDAIIGEDLDGIITNWNPGAERIFGYSASETIGRSTSLLLPPERQNEESEILAELRQGRNIQHFETIRVRKNGSLIDVSVSVSPIKDHSGKLVGASKVARDITQSKMTSEALKKSERDLRLLSEALQSERVRLVEAQALAKLGTWHTDLLTMAVIWSPESHRIFGTDADSFHPKHEDFIEFVHPDDRKAVATAFAASFEKDIECSIEHRVVTADEKVKFVEERWRIVHDADDKPLRAIGTIMDITERKIAQIALVESDQKFHQLSDNITDAFWIRSRDMAQVLYVSPAFETIWGRPVELLYKDPHEWSNFIFPEDRERVHAAFHELTVNSVRLDIEYRIMRPNGDLRWIRLRGFEVRDDENVVIRYAGIVTDITERKVADDALRESELRYHSLFENMIEGYAYCRLIQNEKEEIIDLVYLEVNKAFGELTGLADVVGRKATEVIPGIQESNPELFAIYGRVARTGEPVKFETFVEPLDIWLSITAYSPDRDHLIAVFENITEWKRANEELQLQKTELRVLFDLMPAMIWFKDTENNILRANQRVAEAAGLTLAEIEGKPSADIYPKEAERFYADDRMVIESGKPKLGYLETVPGPEGTEIWVQTDKVPYFDKKGNAIGLVVMAQDVTERKNAETALNELSARTERRERMLTTMLSSMSDFAQIYDQDLRLLFVNQPLLDLWGKTLDEVIGKDFHDLNYPDALAERLQSQLGQVFNSKQPVTDETPFTGADGLPGFYEYIFSPAIGPEGNVDFVIGSTRDVTERKRAQEELSEANVRAVREYEHLLMRVSTLALALGSADDLQEIFRKVRDFALFSTSMNGLFISFYDADRKRRTPVYAWSEGEEVDVSTLPEMEMNSSPHSRAVSTGQVIVTDDFQAAITGNPAINVGLDANPTLPHSSLVVPMAVMGRVVGAVEVQSTELAAFRSEHATALQMAANLAANAIENVRLLENERHQAAQLRHSQKMEAVGVLAGGIAHDFNNLLTAINGYSDLTLRKMNSSDPLRQNIQEVKNAGVRAAELTSQLLAFSRKQVLRSAVINLNTVISNIENMLRRILRESVELRSVLDPKLGNVKADPGQIEQVIMNLAINARDAMPEGGTLTVQTQNIHLGQDYVGHHLSVAAGDFIKLTVTDNGEGMDAATQSQIFDPFFTTKEVGKGTGLGLSTVYGIVKQSGGDIMVYSELGRGTTFKIYLPCVDEIVEKPRWTGERARQYAGTETILLAEDEENVRTLVREILADNGYNVLVAASGAAALSICRSYKEPIHLLLSDVMMPKMGGSELKDEVIKLLPDIKVLFMSGYTDASIVDLGELNNEAAFIEKPFTPDGLSHKVREVLGY